MLCKCTVSSLNVLKTGYLFLVVSKNELRINFPNESLLFKGTFLVESLNEV